MLTFYDNCHAAPMPPAMAGDDYEAMSVTDLKALRDHYEARVTARTGALSMNARKQMKLIDLELASR